VEVEEPRAGRRRDPGTAQPDEAARRHAREGHEAHRDQRDEHGRPEVGLLEHEGERQRDDSGEREQVAQAHVRPLRIAIQPARDDQYGRELRQLRGLQSERAEHHPALRSLDHRTDREHHH
jgi:hypothetical protein